MALGGGDLAFKEALDEVLQGGAGTILLNLSELTYVDSAGLGEIANGFKTVAAKGGRFAACGATGNVRTLFKVTGLDKALKIFDTEADALAELGTS